MKFRLGSKLGYTVDPETPFVFNIEVQTTAAQTVLRENLSMTPQLDVERWTMAESGNRYFRVLAPGGRVEIAYEATVDLSLMLDDPAVVGAISPAELPLSTFTHLYPSRYCQSDKLERSARSTFGSLEPGYNWANRICNWIHDYVAYEGGVSDALTSAFDTVTQRAGVCRDFSHLAIALCRTLGMPARYVNAYASQLDPPDYHAVFEVFLKGPKGGAWYIFDATRMADPAGLVRIGLGRDAAEVAFCSPFGPVAFDKPEVWITPVDGTLPATIRAVRTTLT